jgi:tRNA A-37 threonylcarbamoyl transferase component Bud32
MKLLKTIVREFTSTLKQLHHSKIAHGKIKTTNLFIHEGDFLMTDIYPFGVYNDENYLAPE